MASKKNAAFLKLARDRFKQGTEAVEKQREREIDDLAFYAGKQWPDDILKLRAGQAASNGLPEVPARPCITIVGKVRKPVRQVLNQERGADMGIEIIPADDFGDLSEPVSETEIEIREGLTRRIQRDPKTRDARTWAFARAAIAGWGVYGVMTRYAPGKTRDQDIYVRRFYNQSDVVGDPAREQPDGSDAEWWFVKSRIPIARYNAEYPTRNGQKNRVANCDDGEWASFTDLQPEWFQAEGDVRYVLVVEYFYTEYKPRVVVTYQSADQTQERTEWLDELPDAPAGWEEIERHTDLQKTIHFCKIDGCDDDVLEETEWLGPDMPFIQVLGEELQPYDTERRREGMVRPLREPCQGNNAMISKFVEMVAMTPIPTLMMASGQQEGYEDWYKAATTRTLPYLLYNQKDDNGQPAQQPFAPPNRDMPIGPVATGLQMFNEAIQDSSISDSAMGQTDATVQSAKHANLLREEAAQNTGHLMDNLKRSMEYEAQIVNGLLYPVYGRRPGRLARLINGEGEPKNVLVGVPMTMQNGRPMPAAQGDPNAQTYTLTEHAKFNTAAKIAKNYDTRRQQEAATTGELIGAAPQLMTWFGDLFFKNQDGPGHTEMAERAKVMLDPKILQMIEAKKQGQEAPSPQLQQAQAQIQQLTQVAQQMQQQIQTDAVKEQAETQRSQAETAAKVEIERMKADLAFKIAEMDNLTKLKIEEWKLANANKQAEMDAQQQALGGAADRQHEVGMAAMGSVRDSEASAADREHESAEAREAREAQSMESEAGRMHEAEQAEIARQAAAEQAAMAAQQPQGGA